jgi:hypothetical protein
MLASLHSTRDLLTSIARFAEHPLSESVSATGAVDWFKSRHVLLVGKTAQMEAGADGANIRDAQPLRDQGYGSVSLAVRSFSKHSGQMPCVKSTSERDFR